MKRITAFLLAFCLLVGSTCVVSAQEVGSMSSDNNATAIVTYDVNSNYAILIPETIDLNNSYQFSSTNMDIKPNEEVIVWIESEEVTMTEATTGEKATLFISGFESDRSNRKMVAHFTRGQETSDIGIWGQMSTFSGHYQGTCQFFFELVEQVQ